MCSYFLGTLGAPFIGTMAGAAYKDFAELITAGERIEMLARAGKLPSSYADSNLPGSKKVLPFKKKEGEINHINYQHPSYPLPRNLIVYPTYQAPQPPYPQASYPAPRQSTSPYSNPVPFNVTQFPNHQVNNIPPHRPYVPNRPVYVGQQQTSFLNP